MADQEDRHDESQLGKEDYHLLLEAVRLVPGLETAAQFTKLAMRKLTFPLNSPEDLRPLFDGVEGTVPGTKQEIPLSHLYKYLPSQMFPITSSKDLIGVALKPHPRQEQGLADGGTTGDSTELGTVKAYAKPDAVPSEPPHASAEVTERPATPADSELSPVRPATTEADEPAPADADPIMHASPNGSANGHAEQHRAQAAVEDAEPVTADEASRPASEEQRDDAASRPVSQEQRDDGASQPALEEDAVASHGNAPSVPEQTTPSAQEQETPSGQEQEAPSAQEQDTPSARKETPSAERDTPSAQEETPSAAEEETPSVQEETPSVQDDDDTDEPVEAPYQARHKAGPRPGVRATSRRRASSVDDLDTASLLKNRRDVPSKGWRKLLYQASGGLIRPTESPENRRHRELLARARTPVSTGHHRVAVLSLKGGVGKTTTTACLGATLAQARGDRVIAIDANPDRGTLSDKIQLETNATVRDLLNERHRIKRYVDIRTFTSQAPSRLEILASDRDPSVSEAFTAADYQAVSAVLENFYSICLTDCGTGLLHSAMSGVLGLADQLVVVTSPAVDSARATSATLDWLMNHHHERLVRSATVVLCSVRPRSKSPVDIDQLEAHFAAHCRAVVRVPYDLHLEEGAEIDLERLQPRTRESFLHLAAYVGDGFADPQP